MPNVLKGRGIGRGYPSLLACHTSTIFDCFMHQHQTGQKYEQHPKTSDQSCGHCLPSVRVEMPRQFPRLWLYNTILVCYVLADVSRAVVCMSSWRRRCWKNNKCMCFHNPWCTVVIINYCYSYEAVCSDISVVHNTSEILTCKAKALDCWEKLDGTELDGLPSTVMWPWPLTFWRNQYIPSPGTHVT